MLQLSRAKPGNPASDIYADKPAPPQRQMPYI